MPSFYLVQGRRVGHQIITTPTSPLWTTDFTAGSLDAKLSFARAAGPGAYYNSSGVLSTAGTNTPRFNYAYNGAIWVPKGLLVESSVQNMVAGSPTVNGNYTGAGLFFDNDIVAPDGTTTACRAVADNTTPQVWYWRQTLTFATSTTYTHYAYAKQQTAGIYFYLRELAVNSGSTTTTIAIFDLSNGTILKTGSDLTSSSITNVGNGWYRCTITYTTGGSISFGAADWGYTNSSTDASSGTIVAGTGVYAWGFEVKQTNNPNDSYIATTTVPVTRAADIVSSTDATLLGAAGWIAEASDMVAASNATLVGINTIIGMGEDSSNKAVTTDGGTLLTGNTATWTGTNRTCLTWTGSSVSINLNGGSVATASNTAVTPTNLYFGSTNNGASGGLNGHLRTLGAYPSLTNNDMLTKGVPGAGL